LWRLKLTAIHFNYRLRGRESDGDEAFVSTFCRERRVPLIVQRPTLVKRRRAASMQALARDARYGAMKSLARELGADRIVTGHTANDHAETMLMWMLRGTGLTGLAGMPFVREGLIVRPLLATTREEVLEYLKQEGLSSRQDSSNETSRYRRNRIRRELLPVMAQIAPAIVRLLERQADLLGEDERYLEQVVDQLYHSTVSLDSIGRQGLDWRAFAALPVALQRRLVRRVLKATDTEGRASSLRVVENVRCFVLTGAQGARLSLRQADVARDRERILISQRGRMFPDVIDTHVRTLAIPSSVYWPGTDQKIHVQVMTRQAAESLVGSPVADCVLFDADRLSEPLVVRSWQAGDRFCPSGMKGKRKKLQDLFTDMKVGRQERKRIPLLVAPEGILWVVGWRQDERFLVRESSSRCLVATVEPGSLSEGAT
jgi:tRNA(Ile)-lysidine synthase